MHSGTCGNSSASSANRVVRCRHGRACRCRRRWGRQRRRHPRRWCRLPWHRQHHSSLLPLRRSQFGDNCLSPRRRWRFAPWGLLSPPPHRRCRRLQPRWWFLGRRPWERGLHRESRSRARRVVQRRLPADKCRHGHGHNRLVHCLSRNCKASRRRLVGCSCPSSPVVGGQHRSPRQRRSRPCFSCALHRFLPLGHSRRCRRLNSRWRLLGSRT